MRQKFLIFLALIFLIVVLIGLNAASFMQKEKLPDSEANPNRSTFNTGATGTRAFYDLLSEAGKKVSRWQDNISALSSKTSKNKPQTFVVIGKTRREFDDKEIEQLLSWVSLGGKLVIIDREPPGELIRTTANWNVSADAEFEQPFFTDPADQKQMTEKTSAARPLQPTVFTRNVNSVQPSRFASSVRFERFADSGNYTSEGKISAPPKSVSPEDETDEVKTKIENTDENETDYAESPALAAPVAQLASDEKTLLVDFPFGAGQIVFLSDPYIVSNGGINLADNARLAINIVASGDGLIAFDEFHQNFNAGENRLLAYFAGTPFVAIFLQIVALAAFVFFSQSRRFARPLPENESPRLAKLEYVSAMAELQQRARAFDLAMENIYKDFRRRAARLVGADNSAVSYKKLAGLISERGDFKLAEIENLLFKCEDIIHGEPTDKREVLDLTSQLREVEEKLGLRRVHRQFFGK